MSAPASSSFAGALDVVGDVAVRISDVVDRDALGEMCTSTHDLFGIGVHVYSAEGILLASSGKELAICALVNESPEGRLACGSTVTAARSTEPGDNGDVTHECFSGLAYRIVSLDYEGRRVGRIVLGPYAPAGLRTAPPSLTGAAPKLDVLKGEAFLAKVARVKPEAVRRIARHLKTTLELIVFSSHKAYVTSKLHLHSVRANYRALEEKTARLEQALTRLRELDRLRSTFLGTVSHELRTPLTSIIGFSEMLAEGMAGPLTEEQAEFIRTIHAKGEQLLALILSLLDLSKLDSGTMSIRKGKVDVAAIIQDVATTLKPTSVKKGVEIFVEKSEEACEVTGDPERLRQVFLNLAENALKFTPKGGSVTLRACLGEGPAPDGDESGAVLLAPLRRGVTVTVADTGIGIAKAERSKVFDAFYQVDSSSTRAYGGTGLGLSIVKRIVDAHGGSIAIEANQPTGTVFIVTLPTTQAPRTISSQVPSPGRP